MPGTDDHDQRKAQDQEAERKRHAEENSAEDKAIKEPESGSSKVEAGKIIGNG